MSFRASGSVSWHLAHYTPDYYYYYYYYYHHHHLPNALAALQITKSVCVSARGWYVCVSQFVTQRVERSTDCSIQPIFTKLCMLIDS